MARVLDVGQDGQTELESSISSPTTASALVLNVYTAADITLLNIS